MKKLLIVLCLLMLGGCGKEPCNRNHPNDLHNHSFEDICEAEKTSIKIGETDVYKEMRKELFNIHYAEMAILKLESEIIRNAIETAKE